MKFLYLFFTCLFLNGCAGFAIIWTEKVPSTESIGESKESILSANSWQSENLSVRQEGDFEVVTYDRNQWCGAMVFVVPLMLPVCEGGEEYYLKQNVVVRETEYTLNASGIICSIFPQCEKGNNCKLCSTH